MWTPTHVNITVHKARNLKSNGKSEDNDSYVIVHLDDLTFTTSVKTRTKSPEWNENCDIPLPKDLKDVVLRLTVHHRNLFSLDEFLGEANIALKHFPVYERPQSRWYFLANLRRRSRHGVVYHKDVVKEELGELQITLTFMVQSQKSTESSSGTFQRQRSLSFRSLANRVGTKLISGWNSQTDVKTSRLSDLTERKCPVHSMLELHKVSQSFHHLHLSQLDNDVSVLHRNDRGIKELNRKTVQSVERRENNSSLGETVVNRDKQRKDEQSSVTTCKGAFQELIQRRPIRPRSLQTLTEECQESKRSETTTYKSVKDAKNVGCNSCGTPAYADDYILRASHKRHSYIGSGEVPPMVAAYRLNEIEDVMVKEKHILQQNNCDEAEKDDVNNFEGYDRDDLVNLVLEQQTWINIKRAYVQDLEEYIDSLLIRVLEANHQSILENPYKIGNRPQHPKKSDEYKKRLTEKLKKKQILDLLKIWKQ